tara:strand:+ start:174 stop:800 length:627 start_codon:yes stop_codon:yes gene_type:complete
VSDADGQPEPTIEEILASIRHIISEDGEAVKISEDEVKDELGLEGVVEEGPKEEAFDLTESLEQEEQEPLILRDLVEEEDEPLVLRDLVEEESKPKLDFDIIAEDEAVPILETEAFSWGPDSVTALRGDGLASDESGEQTAAAFVDFASTVSNTQRVPLGASDRTLEELVKELLRPMLKDWLNNNLQPIVSQSVEREIAKLAGRADED